MTRKLAIMVFAFLIAIPAFPDVRQAPKGPQVYPALHLMSNIEFAQFLRRLDQGVRSWKVRLGHMDLRSLSIDRQEGGQLERSYDLCLQSLNNTHEEIQKLSQKQTLKLDFLLLVDLNDLARNLDGLNRDLVDASAGASTTARESLGYAREVLGIDTVLAPPIAEFQQYILAFAGVIDVSRDQAEPSTDRPQSQN
jgi:hypothetical protein